MSRISDEILNKEAQKLVEAIDRDFEAQEARQSQNGEVIDIKLAKAKSGARRHINRTVRICAVAAVLMIGIVCALFMGAKDESAISLETDAYMWRNNSADAENMKVKVKINFEQVNTFNKGNKNSYTSEFMGNIVITDLNGDILYNFCHIQLFLSEDYKYPGGLLMEYADTKECPNGHKDEEGRRIGQFGAITFNEGMSRFTIMIYEGTDRLWAHDEAATNSNISYALFVTSGVSSREEAVEFNRMTHPGNKEYAEKFNVLWDEESQSYYK